MFISIVSRISREVTCRNKVIPCRDMDLGDKTGAAKDCESNAKIPPP